MRKIFLEEEFVSNTTKRIPICLCIDTSGSMNNYDGTSKKRIERVKDGIKQFYSEINKNSRAKLAAEVAIVGFSDTAYKVQEFTAMENLPKDTVLEASSGGQIGLGVEYSLKLLNERKKMYNEAGVDYYQPWLVIMTDGHPTGSGNLITKIHKMQAKTCEMEENRKLTIITVFVGEQTESNNLKSIDSKAFEILSGFSKYKEPIILNPELEYGEFFEWLGKSVAIVDAEKLRRIYFNSNDKKESNEEIKKIKYINEKTDYDEFF